MFSAASELMFGDPMEAGKVMGLAPYGTATLSVGAFFSIEDGLLMFGDEVPARRTCYRPGSTSACWSKRAGFRSLRRA